MEETTNKEFEMRLSETAAEYLKESARWSSFLSIIGFIGIGFMVLAAVFITFVSSLASTFNASGAGALGSMEGMFSGIYLLFALLYFFPVYYLFKYAKGMKEALVLRDSNALESALGYLKSHHKFIGIMMIVLISLYILILVGFIFAAVLFGKY